MKIYHLNINSVTDSQIQLWFEQMSSERKEAVSSIKISRKRKSKIIADALCRKAINEYCGVNPEDIVFKYNRYGKPYVKNIPVHFSISHSGNYVVCAVSENEIGIDIEKIRDIDSRICKRFATEAEADYISSNQNRIFEIWTLKEAYFKCIGTGLTSDIKNISFDISGENINCSENGFKLSFTDIDKNYICSVCEKAAQS